MLTYLTSRGGCKEGDGRTGGTTGTESGVAGESGRGCGRGGDDRTEGESSAGIARHCEGVAACHAMSAPFQRP
jgi:hypothetical protein